MAMKTIRGKILAITQPFIVASELVVDEKGLVLLHINRINFHLSEAGLFNIESLSEDFDFFSTFKVGDIVSFETEDNRVFGKVSILRC